MMQSGEDIDIDGLPVSLPVFPLSGVLLLPRGQLPLNIFEPRYLAMVEDSFKNGRLIGMVQPQDAEKNTDSPELYRTGCGGRITEFSETDDGRFLITLTGLCRFNVIKELEEVSGYRRAKVTWTPFEADLKPEGCIDIDREKLRTLLENYFDMHELSCDWSAFEKAPDERLITCLSMVCPLGAKEKQALLEADCCASRADMFMAMLEMALHDRDSEGRGCH